jgi:hypothetical protein
LDLTPMNQPTAPSVARPASVNPFELNRRVLASELTLAAKAVLLVILDHARHGASTCTASTRTIAREARVAERTVRHVLPDLEGRGLVTIERATGSVHSRHTIRVGPCIHQVGNPFRLRLHEVGNDCREVGKPGMHEVGNDCPQRINPRDEKDSGPSVAASTPAGPEDEEPSPWTRRWFGRLIDVDRSEAVPVLRD